VIVWQDLSLVQYGFFAVLAIILISVLFQALVNWERTIGNLICLAAIGWGTFSYVTHNYFQLFLAVLLGIFGFIIITKYSSDK
jgi:general stress protein CsbA